MSLQTDLNFSGTIEEDSEDNTIIKDASDDQSQDQEDAEQFDQCMESGQGPADSSSQTAPIQKRRRVTRACDECRRKKIKCDGKHPCTHCTIYTYECTYDQPSHRRRNPAPQYVEALETKLRRAEMLLQNYVPEVDLNDPSLDSALLSQEALPQKQEKGLGLLGRGGNWSSRTAKQQSVDAKTDSQLESMVEITGSLDLDDDGNWDFYGHSSGRVFLRKMREQFGTLMGKTSDPKAFAMPPHKKKSSSQPISSPSSSVQSPLEPRTPSTHDLPSKDYARLLCQNVLDDACAVLRFVHQPTFYAMFDRVYDLPPDNQGTEEMKFLPLLYSVIAVGALFATAEQSQLMTNGVQNAIQQGSHWYNTARSMTDVTDCRDLTSLQTVLFMIMFLQSSAELSSCYTYIGICLRSALRIGLHRAVKNNFDPVEREVRKRIFWSIRKMDVYVSILLGLPQTLHDIDIDQDQPLEVDDDYITTERLLFMPPGRAPLMAGFNAHNRMVTILSKVVEYVYPIKADKNSQKDSYIVSHAKIREIENDLKQWTETLPEPFRPGSDGPKEYVRIQHILRMAYAHIQMFLYRPFLHYASLDTTAKALDKTSFACAAACVSVSRNIVHLTGEMNRRGLLVGSFWFYNYTTFFAIIGLVFYVLENPHSATSVEVLKDAREGKDTLLTLASKSLAADRCSKYLSDLFDQLSPKLNDLHVKPASQKKRQNPSQSHRLSHGYNNAAQLVADANTNHLPQMNTSAGQPKRWDQPSYPFNLGINASYPNGTQGHYLPTPAPIQTPQSPGTSMYTNTTTGPGGRGFSAMMFPSADPFAYPNQPLTTLDNQQQIKQEEPIHPSMFNTESSAGIDQSMYGMMPPYGLTSPGREDGFTNASHSVGGQHQVPNPPPFSHSAHPWPPQQQLDNEAQGMQFGHSYGEDWGGWMQPGARR